MILHTFKGCTVFGLLQCNQAEITRTDMNNASGKLFIKLTIFKILHRYSVV